MSEVKSLCDRYDEVLKERDHLIIQLNGAHMMLAEPIPMILTCPQCSVRHIDVGEFAEKHHHTHACQSCGMVWRPAISPTVGVQFLPGFKNDENHDS